MHLSHALLLLLAGGGCLVASVGVLADDVRILEHGVVNGGKLVVVGHTACRRVRTQRPSEEENEGLGLVDFVVDPATRLLHSEIAPLFFVEEASAGHVTVDGLGQ